MTNKIGIWSQASVALGNGPQQDEAADNTFCNNAREVYDTVLEERLSTHRWGFNREKVALSRLSAAPINEWQYAYQMEPTALAIFKVYPSTRYLIYGDKIFTNVTSLDVDFLSRPVETKFPAYFVKAMVAQLAADLCYAVTDDANLVGVLERKADNLWMRAWTADAQQRPTEAVQDQPFIWVRNA